MRLTQAQVEAIRNSAKEVFGEGAKVWLFGSRVDDAKRGGDIDLLVRPTESHVSTPLISKMRFLNMLEASLGERKMDVVIVTPIDTRPIVRVAHETGVLL